MRARMKEYEAKGINTVYLTDVLYSCGSGLARMYFINGVPANPFLASEIRAANFRKVAEEGRYRKRGE